MGKSRRLTKKEKEKRGVVAKYTDLKAPASFTGVSKLRKHHFRDRKSVAIRDALGSLDAYTKHKPVRRKFVRNKTITGAIDQQWQLDLMDMQGLASDNDGFRYVLTAIDVFSRYAWAAPIKSKGGAAVTEAFETITTERHPRYVQTDKGKEFLNKTFQDHLKSRDIEFFTGENDDIKASLVERLNRTLKEKLWRYFTHKRTYRYVDVLDKVVSSYNRTHHKTLNMAPADVNAENSEAVFYRRDLPTEKQIKKMWKKTDLGGSDSQVVVPGDRVRMLSTKGPFRKGYEGHWKEEVVNVARTLGNRGFELKDDTGEEIKGVWYPEEVQKVSKSRYNDTYFIDKVLRYKTVKGKRLAFVRWVGYDDKFNEWIPVNQISDKKKKNRKKK